MIYLSVFFVSAWLLRRSEKKKNKLYKTALVIIALFLPSILAGVRDYSIGTDIYVYGNYWFENAVRDTDFKHYIIWGTSSSIDAIYCIINFFVSRFSNNPHWFYFVLNFITNILVYKAARDNEDIVEPYYVMLTYYILFYNQSLNMLRQSLALAFTVCSFIYVRRNNYIKFMICTGIAFLAHRASIIVILLLVIYKIVNSQVRMFGKILVLLGSLVALVGMNYIYGFLANIGLLPTRYEKYFNVQQRGGFYTHLCFFCAPYIILMFLCLKKEIPNLAEREAINGLKFYLMFSAVVGCVAARMVYVTRIVLYFDIMMIFAVPLIARNLRVVFWVNKKDYTGTFLVLWMLVYWVVIYAVKNSGETFPYVLMTFSLE